MAETWLLESAQPAHDGAVRGSALQFRSVIYGMVCMQATASTALLHPTPGAGNLPGLATQDSGLMGTLASGVLWNIDCGQHL